MYIKEFYIDNFRGYRKFKINSNKDLNLLTGLNNCGKTTILEAISLWNEIFDYLIVKALKADNKLNIRAGDYRFSNKRGNYFDYRKFNSVRTYGYKDIFYNLNSSNNITLEALIKLNDDNEIKIGFIIESANGSNYSVYLKNHDTFDFRTFNNSFDELPSAIGCYFSSPVATLPFNEEFVTEPKIREGIKTRQSVLFFRNRLFKLYNSTATFQVFKTKLSNILFNNANSIDFRIIGDQQNDVNIVIEANIKNKGFRNISLLGSGTIQIIEILLHLFENKRNLNIILLDEPDSHIHRDIQKRLINELINNDIQFFLTSHNESLLRSTNPKNIFLINDDVSNNSLTEYSPIYTKQLTARKSGISPSYHSHIMHKIGTETSLDLLNMLEADNIFFVEGSDDADYIRKILEINDIESDCVFWAFDGFDNLIAKIKNYKVFFEGIGNTPDLWVKCKIIVDADYTTTQQKNLLKQYLENKTSLKCFVWDTYTIESTILKNKDKLAEIINNHFLVKGYTIDLEDIKFKITELYNNFIALKTNEMDNSVEFCNRVQGQIDARKENLKNSLEITRVFSGNNLSNSYRIYCKSEFQNNVIDHITNKDDVENILVEIFNHFSVPIEIDIKNRLFELMNTVHKSIQPDLWEDLIQFTNQN